MSRNGSGTYTLPAGNPVVTGTTIETSWANTTLSDIATALTDSLSRSGQGGMTAAFRGADGTSGLPGISFTNETTTGLYRAGSADLRLAITTNQIQQWLTTGTSVTGTLTVSGNTTISNLTASKVVFTDGSKVLTSTGTVGIDQGGTGATTDSTARTNLGATTVGSNFFTLANPSAITFIRVNADNTVSTLNAADFRTAIGAGTGGGDVTGPGSSTSGNVATFNGTTGKIIQDGGKALPSGTIVGTSDTQTLTNKRSNPRVSSATTASSVTPDISSFDQYAFTALAEALTINAPTGTPVDGNRLIFRILDNGVSRALNWNGTYTAIGVTLPTSTTVSKTTYVGCIYNANNTRWDVIAVTTQA